MTNTSITNNQDTRNKHFDLEERTLKFAKSVVNLCKNLPNFAFRIRISRKEAKETIFWLELLREANPNLDVSGLIQECTELRNIFSAIINKIEK